MKRCFFALNGFSLVELMITMALLTIIGTAVGSLFLNTQKSFNHTTLRINGRREASLVLRTIEQELRQNSESTADFESIKTADKSLLIFYADIDNDDKPEQVEYSLTGGKLTKTVTQTSNEAVPWEFNGTTKTETLSSNLKNDDSKPLFTYYSDIDTTLSNLPLNKEDRKKIKIVKIDIPISLSQGTKEDEFETEVYLRNKNDPL